MRVLFPAALFGYSAYSVVNSGTPIFRADFVVDDVQAGGGLDSGAAYWVCNAMLCHDMPAQQVAEEVAQIGRAHV